MAPLDKVILVCNRPENYASRDPSTQVGLMGKAAVALLKAADLASRLGVDADAPMVAELRPVEAHIRSNMDKPWMAGGSYWTGKFIAHRLDLARNADQPDRAMFAKDNEILQQFRVQDRLVYPTPVYARGAGHRSFDDDADQYDGPQDGQPGRRAPPRGNRAGRGRDGGRGGRDRRADDRERDGGARHYGRDYDYGGCDRGFGRERDSDRHYGGGPPRRGGGLPRLNGY
jgi:hypothetical protein